MDRKYIDMCKNFFLDTSNIAMTAKLLKAAVSVENVMRTEKIRFTTKEYRACAEHAALEVTLDREVETAAQDNYLQR